MEADGSRQSDPENTLSSAKQTMRKIVPILAMAAVGVLAMAFGPLALGQRTSAPVMPENGRFGNPNAYARDYQDYLYGVVAKISSSALLLNKTKFGVPTSVRLMAKTKFIRNGKRGSLKQLKTGDMVYVQVKKDKKTGDLMAKKVVSGVGAMGGV
jgi:hypothetical protein